MDKNNWFHHFLQHKYMERQGLKKKDDFIYSFSGLPIRNYHKYSTYGQLQVL